MFTVFLSHLPGLKFVYLFNSLLTFICVFFNSASITLFSRLCFGFHGRDYVTIPAYVESIPIFLDNNRYNCTRVTSPSFSPIVFRHCMQKISLYAKILYVHSSIWNSLLHHKNHLVWGWGRNITLVPSLPCIVSHWWGIFSFRRTIGNLHFWCIWYIIWNIKRLCLYKASLSVCQHCTR